MNKTPDFIINSCFAYYDEVNYDSMNYVFSHIVLLNVVYMTNVLKKNGIAYTFTFEHERGIDLLTSTPISAFILYIVYEYESVVIKLNVPIDYLFRLSVHFSPLCPVLNKECPICFEGFQKCVQCSQCQYCVCENCYNLKLQQHNTKCPLCNLELQKIELPVKDSYAFLETHHVDYETLFSPCVYFCDFMDNVIPSVLIGKKAFNIKHLINVYHDIL